MVSTCCPCCFAPAAGRPAVLPLLQFCFFLLHWAACGFWFVALQEGGSANSRTWVAQELQMLDGSSTIEL